MVLQPYDDKKNLADGRIGFGTMMEPVTRLASGTAPCNIRIAAPCSYTPACVGTWQGTAQPLPPFAAAQTTVARAAALRAVPRMMPCQSGTSPGLQGPCRGHGFAGYATYAAIPAASGSSTVASSQPQPQLLSPALPPASVQHCAQPGRLGAQAQLHASPALPTSLGSPLMETPAVPSVSSPQGSLPSPLPAPCSCRSLAGAPSPSMTPKPEVDVAKPAAPHAPLASEALPFQLPEAEASKPVKKKSKAQKAKKRCACCD